MKKIRQFLQFSILFLLSAGSFSCRVFHQQDKITDFLEDGANRIKIVKTAYNVDVQIDKDGYVCIPSNNDVEIYFLIQNPKGLSLDYKLASLLDDKIIIMQKDYMNYLSDEEKEILNFKEKDCLYPDTKVEYSLGQQLLYRLEKGLRYDGTVVDVLGPGCTLDPKLGLNAASYSYKPVAGEFFTDEEYAEYRAAWLTANGCTEADVTSDSDGQEIVVDSQGNELKVPQTFTMNVEAYTSNIRINTPPPYVQGACIMLDESTKTASSTGNYVICFNLPDTVFYADGIHRDVKKLYVTGLKASNARELEEGIELNIDFDAGTYTNDALSLETGSTANLKKLYENNPYYNDGMPAVEFNPGEHPVYIWDDGHSFSKEPDYTYTVTLEDEAGLRSTVVLNSRYLQLDKPTARNGDRTYDEGVIYLSFPVDEEGNPTIKYFVLNLVAPDKTVGTAVKNITDVNVHYEIYSLNILRDQHNTGLIYTNIANYQEGSALDAKALRLTNGTLYDIRAYAYKDGYLGSELAHWYVTSGNYRYVDVEVATALTYVPEIGMDRWDDTLNEYNYKVYVMTDADGNVQYEDVALTAADGTTSTVTLPKVRYDDFSVNMALKLYNYYDWYDSAENEEDRVKTYLDDEEALEYIRSLKMYVKDTEDYCPELSYADNTNMRLLSNFSNRTSYAPDDVTLQTYVDTYGTDMTEKMSGISVRLPDSVVRAIAYAFEDGDYSYNIEMYADIGDENNHVSFSSTNKINVRYIYVAE